MRTIIFVTDKLYVTINRDCLFPTIDKLLLGGGGGRVKERKYESLEKRHNR